MLTKVTNIFISDGTALPTAGASITTAAAGDIFIADTKMNELTPGNTISDTDKIYLGQVDSTSNFKRSMEILGRQVTNWKGQSYTASKRDVWSFGYDRKLATGTFEVNNSTDYTFSLTFTYAKNLYSERPLYFRRTFRTDASTSKAEIAAAIFNILTNDEAVNTLVTPILVGNGTNTLAAATVSISGSNYTVYGGTGATEYGVEVMAKTLTQFNTGYLEQRVSFVAAVDDSTGFGTTTTCTNILKNDIGTGMYQWVYNMENFDFGYEGVLNRTKFPIPTLTYQASNTFYDSSVIGVNVTTVIGSDVALFASSVAAILSDGDRVVLDGVNYEIKYFIDSTHAVLTTAITNTIATTNTAKKRMQYDILNIEFKSPRIGATQNTNTENIVVIAVPAIDSAGAYNSTSTAGTGVLAALNPYFASLGFANVSI